VLSSNRLIGLDENMLDKWNKALQATEKILRSEPKILIKMLYIR
jgi:hypothetical protein